MDKAVLAKRIKKAAYLTGQFKLRSGKTSSFYWDKYRFESDPELLSDVVAVMEDLLPDDFDKLAGLEMGGIPLATILSARTGKPCLYVRKKAKEYGTCNLLEGGFSAGERVVVVEDVITTAGQVCTSIEELRGRGLAVELVVCAIDRQQGGTERIAEAGCTLRAAFTLEEIERLVGSE